VDPGATSPAIPIPELVSSDPGDHMMFIRFVVLGAEDCGPLPSIHPTVILVRDGTDHSVLSVDGHQPTMVGAGVAATVHRPGSGGRGVYLLEVYKTTQQPIDWQIRFRNNDPTAARRFTWVVADQKTQTLQPWINLQPTTASIEFSPGEPVTPQPIQVANLGTGRLKISDPQGFSPKPGSGFVLADVPGAISPNACAELQIGFSAVDPTAPLVAVYTATSNDTTAQATPGHNRQLTITATHKGLPPGTIILLSFTSDESDPAGKRSIAEVIQVDPVSGDQTVISTLPPSEEGASTNGVLVDTNGDILVAAQSQLIRVDPATGNQTPVASGHLPRGVTGMAREADGKILISAGGRLVRVDLTRGAQTQVPTTSTEEGLAVEADGNILFGTWTLPSAKSKVIRVDPATGDQTVVTSGDRLGGNPWGVALEADGKILVTSRGSGLVRVDPVTGRQTLVAAFPFATGVAVEADGNILVGTVLSTAGVSTLIRVNPRTGTQSAVCFLSTSPVRGVHGIAVVPVTRATLGGNPS
jgi:streptogramin lyase